MPARRPRKSIYSDGASLVSFTYNEERTHTVNNSTAAITYGHDLLNRVTSRSQVVSYATYTLTETDHSGPVVSYSPDSAGRVNGVTEKKGTTPDVV